MNELYNSCYKRVFADEQKAIIVALTTDTWTSINNVSFIMFTAHFIDTNYNLKSILLGISLLMRFHVT